MMSKLREFSSNAETADKVIMFIAILVGFLAVALVIGIFAAVFWAPEDNNIVPLVELISNAFLMLTGAIVGYIGGQGVARGTKKDEEI